MRWLLTALLVLVSIPAAGASDFLSIKFSEKNKVKTALTWIQFKSQLILSPGTERKERLPAGSNARAIPDEQTLKDPAYSRVGKLFFTTDYGQVSQCSASFVGDNGLIATAAHCVMTVSGDWNADFIFFRGYGSKDQDLFAIDRIALNERWGDSRDETVLNTDYALLRTTRDNPFGGLHVRLDEAPPAKVRIVGYSDDHLDGRKMLEVKVDTLISQTQIAAFPNPLGNGNSGAPWISLEGTDLYSLSSHYNRYERNKMWVRCSPGKSAT